MARIGHGDFALLARPSPRPLVWVFVGAAAAIATAIVFVGFTVDDALVPVRYAQHVARGEGWTFNRDALPSDGVTPLPLPLLLAPLCHAATIVALVRVRAAMALFSLGNLAVLLRAVRASGPSWLAWALLAMALGLLFPLAAYASCGMETPLATLLATAAATSSSSPRRAAIFAGLSATIRPELAPWALVLAFGLGVRTSPRGDGTIALPLREVALAIAPPVACAIARLVAFGSPAPLALLAKPSDVATGARYVATALLTTSAPLLALAPRALVRAGRVPLTLVCAFLVHAGVVALVGGDWMPFARLFAPVLPSLLYAFVLATHAMSAPWLLLRAALAFGCACVALVTTPPELRHLWSARLELAARARPVLADARRVAVLDIGWPTLATDADLVDLAGLTDPAIAALPGGHTSKHVDATFLLGRHPDRVLLYTNDERANSVGSWRDLVYPRAIESRLAADDLFASHVTPVAFLPLGAGGYVVLRVSP